MDKGLKVPKWLLINCSKIPQMPQSFPAQVVYPMDVSIETSMSTLAQKFGISMKKGFI